MKKNNICAMCDKEIGVLAPAYKIFKAKLLLDGTLDYDFEDPFIIHSICLCHPVKKEQNKNEDWLSGVVNE